MHPASSPPLPRLAGLAGLVLFLAAMLACGSGDLGRRSAAAAPRGLRILGLSGRTMGAVPLPPIRVRVEDGAGDLAADDGPAVTLALRRGGAVLGTWTAPVRGGVATFGGVVVAEPGSGYVLQASGNGYATTKTGVFDVLPRRRHVILMIADGWGYKQVEATRRYRRAAPVYAGWTQLAMATWNVDTQRFHGGRGYSPTRAWSQFAYPILAATDSGAAATAMYTGVKTDLGNISVSSGDRGRLMTLAEIARKEGLSTGSVTTVPLSHATPGAWLAHNSNRYNGFAIADEMLWGDPNTTGTVKDHRAYGGGWGRTLPGPDVVMGGGHPAYSNDIYVNNAIRTKLRTESGKAGAFRLVERLAGKRDAAARLLRAAADPKVERLAALFGGAAGNLEFRRADGSGRNPENPTLADMSRAALAVLGRKPRGFALMIEGGAVDWAGHRNDLDACIGEMIDFDLAVAEVVRWVDDTRNGSSWANTLLIVTGDHECGYLTRAPGIFPDRALGEVSPRTLKLEKLRRSTGRRMSWEDRNNDGEINAGEPVYWAWNSGWHSNSLIPLFARGDGADEFAKHVVATDPVRGKYIDNTAVFQVMQRVVTRR